MPRLGLISRADLIRNFHRLGYDGPYSTGGTHEFMVKGTRRVPKPNPHRGEISTELLARVLRRAGIQRNEWEGL